MNIQKILIIPLSSLAFGFFYLQIGNLKWNLLFKGYYKENEYKAFKCIIYTNCLEWILRFSHIIDPCSNYLKNLWNVDIAWSGYFLIAKVRQKAQVDEPYFRRKKKEPENMISVSWKRFWAHWFLFKRMGFNLYWCSQSSSSCKVRTTQFSQHTLSWIFLMASMLVLFSSRYGGMSSSFAGVWGYCQRQWSNSTGTGNR